MKLELKHLTPFLPYSLRCKTPEGVKVMTTLQNYCVGFTFQDASQKRFYYPDIKPILRPLSDLTKDKNSYIQFLNMFKDSDENIDYLCEFKGDLSNTNLSYKCVEFLLSTHFDVFGLIENNLGIDINTLNK